MSNHDCRMFGPKGADHPSIGEPCPACHVQLKAGDYTTLICLGLGDDPEAQAKATSGSPYNAVAVEVHWSCATGLAPPDQASAEGGPCL